MEKMAMELEVCFKKLCNQPEEEKPSLTKTPTAITLTKAPTVPTESNMSNSAPNVGCCIVLITLPWLSWLLNM